MNTNELKARLAELADAIDSGPVPPVHLVEAESRQLRRRRRTHWTLGASAAGIAAAVVVPMLIVQPATETSSNPQPPSPAATTPADEGTCTPTVGTTGGWEGVVLVKDDCSTEPLAVPAKTTYPALSPDGERLAYVTYQSGDAHLQVVDLDGGEPTTLATSTDTIGDPVWSPDGATLAFWLNDGQGHPYIHVVPVAGGEPTRVTTTPTGTTEDINELSPAWSPDGEALAFTRADGQIWTVNVATGQERQLAAAPYPLEQPFWGTNGQELYALDVERVDGPRPPGSPPDTFRMVQMDAATGAPQGRSGRLTGTPTAAAVVDDDRIRVAALTGAGPTTTIYTLDHALSVAARSQVDGAEIRNLAAATADEPEQTTQAPEAEPTDQPEDDLSTPRVVQDEQAPVAPDLELLAEAFVRYAIGDSNSFPHANSVSMSLGGHDVLAIDDIAAALSDRRIWKICPADWEVYGASSCPVDLLGPIAAAAFNEDPIVLSAQYGDVTCAPTRSGPPPNGRLVVLRPEPKWRTCASDYALALAADEHGQLQSIDLTLSVP